MKKPISLLLILAFALAIFAGCGNAGNKAAGSSNGQEATAPARASDGSAAVTSDIASTGYPVVDLYSGYTTAKGEMYSNLSDALSSNDSTAMASLSLLGVAMVDMALIPVSCFGIGDEAAESALGFIGTDAQYEENGNTYTVSYKGSDGKTFSLTGVWDAAANSMVCTGSTDGKEDIYAEFRKTSYGYIGQYYMLNSDGTSAVYIITVQGKDGFIGISNDASKPAAFTGSEPVDYPSKCAEWYAINGTAVTGKASDGTAINFEYVAPAAT